MENIIERQDFFKAMDRFKENDRLESEICTKQEYQDDKIIEKWYNKDNGSIRIVSFERTGAYNIVQ